MLAAQSLSLLSSTQSCSSLSSRQALADSTNLGAHSNVCGPAYPKSCVFPTSSTRTACVWNDLQSSTGSVLVLARHHPLFSTPSPFPVTSKAPPTLSISLSAACSQNVPREQLRGSSTQSLEADLPDVTSVVPFPTTPLGGDTDMDTDMLDGTCSDGQTPSARPAPRKRHSAQSCASSSPSGLGKDVKQKRPRKSKRQVAELWWLGVVHRSILHGIEARQSVGALCTSDPLLSGQCELDTMDRTLVERIQRRLAENGCVEGRAILNPLPRISSPTISVPSVILAAPSRKVLSTGSALLSPASESNSTGDIFDGTASALRAPPCTPLSIISHPTIPSSTSTSTSPTRHIRFESPQRPRQPHFHPRIPRRSPSPPARTGAVSSSGQILTLTMPQLVASLTLAYRERSGLRLRGRTYKVTEYEKNAGRSAPSQGVQCNDGDSTYDKMHGSSTTRTRFSSALERKSPLSRVAFAES